MSGGVLAPLMSMLCYDLPWSTGALNEIVEINAEEGTINNAKFPAACSMASIQGAFATQNVVSNAIAKMLCCSSVFKKEAQACWAPYWNGPGTTGINQRGEFFVGAMAEGGGGGGGARTFRDGIDCGGMIHSLCAAIPNVETNEYLQPVIELYRRYCPDTCGHGRWRGGAGLEYAYATIGIKDPITLRMVVCGVSLPGAQGLLGGYPPSINVNAVLHDTNIYKLLKSGKIPSSMEDIESSEMEILPAKSLSNFFPGDVHVGIVSGGSGYGDPLKRDPELVCLDILRNKVTHETSRDIYGVVLMTDGKTVDKKKTIQLRSRIIAKREKNSQKPLKKIGESKEYDLKNQKFQLPVSDFLELRSATKSGKNLIFCTTCGKAICPPTSNIREYLAKSKPIGIGYFSSVNRLCAEPAAFLLEFYCPSCHTLLSTDIVLKKTTRTLWPEFELLS
jgi:N-methylhydantoinase B